MDAGTRAAIEGKGSGRRAQARREHPPPLITTRDFALAAPSGGSGGEEGGEGGLAERRRGRRPSRPRGDAGAPRVGGGPLISTYAIVPTTLYLLYAFMPSKTLQFAVSY